MQLYDPRLQSPEYGGRAGPRPLRARRVQAGPPARRPGVDASSSRTLLEFPPAVRDGLVVVGTNSGRVYALDARHRAAALGAPPARRDRLDARPSPGTPVLVTSMDGRLLRLRRGRRHALLDLLHTGSPIESSPLVVGGLVYVGRTGRAPLRGRRPDRAGALDLPGAAPAIKGSAALAGGRWWSGDYARQRPRPRRPHRAPSGGRYSRRRARFYGGPGGERRHDRDRRRRRRRHRPRRPRPARSAGATRPAGRTSTPRPAIAGGTVFIGSYDGASRRSTWRPGAAALVASTSGGRISGSATVVGGVVYTAVPRAPGDSPAAPTGSTRPPGRCASGPTTGRYSPAVGAGVTLYLVGTRTIECVPRPAP